MEEKQEKVLYFCTHSADDPERASLPFVMANAALAMDIGAGIALQGKGVELAQKGYADKMLPTEFPPMKKLLEDFMALGGKLWVCVPCIKARNIEESDLVEGAETTAAGALNVEAIEADAVFVY
jgi:uncharacterized protein involved in oxidation of intracellular sulfur